jgi:enoyl-CoA hydratase/carnithine racemase
MIEYTLVEKIAVIRLDINKFNVFDYESIIYLQSLFEKAKLDEKILGLIITGNSTSFCTGIAIESMIEEHDKQFVTSFLKQNDNFLFEVFQFPKPLVAIVNGHSIGEGLLLQLCSDYIIMENQSKIKIGLPELNIGLTLSPLMMDILEFYLPRKQISNLLLEGSLFNFEIACKHQFVDRIAEKDESYKIAKIKVKEFLRSGSGVFQSVKLSIRQERVQIMQRHLNDIDYRNYLIELAMNKKNI